MIVSVKQLGGGVSPRLRYTTTVMTESSPDCPPYTKEEFGVATMICGSPVYGIEGDGNKNSIKASKHFQNLLKLFLVGSITSSSPCTFDGGSPLVQDRNQDVDPPVTEIDLIVVGVLSNYSPDCKKDVPSVYTRLSVYYAWLNRIAGSQVLFS